MKTPIGQDSMLDGQSDDLADVINRNIADYVTKFFFGSTQITPIVWIIPDNKVLLRLHRPFPEYSCDLSCVVYGTCTALAAFWGIQEGYAFVPGPDEGYAQDCSCIVDIHGGSILWNGVTDRQV